ncbi:MAG: pyridoxal-phosphate dependent enzyme [Gemmatimonadetes bacterium]|nr:pyridoxal-phosphate dependent enzyme [Gemmatimonadota bacterium]
MTTPPRHEHAYGSVLDTIGWTPMIRLNRVAQGIKTPVFAKAEFMNPGGSVKDRVGPAIVEAAEREGRLRPGGTIVEGTSGNTGVGLALAAGAILGQFLAQPARRNISRRDRRIAGPRLVGPQRWRRRGEGPHRS